MARRPIRLLVSMATTLAVATALTVASGAPAQAADIPAYGSITISNQGAGAVVETTYDTVLWNCTTEVEGQFNAPTAITVECRAAESESFVCPLMVLTTHTAGLAARAGGYAACTSSLDTGIISGFNTAQRTGNLGRAYSVTCMAYGGGVPMLPPYTVTCNEPGLPVVSL